jgi:transposase
VPVKSVDQHVLAGFHRLRSAWMATRTTRLNTVRGLLRELGFSIPVGARQVVPHVGTLVSDADSGLPDSLRPVLAEAAREIRELEARVREVEHALESLSRGSELLGRLRTILGVGLLTATALVAFVGDVQRFPSSRRFASYLGLTPRESSSGLRRHLGPISKRGDHYLRMLLIHGARAVLLHAKKPTAEPDRLRAVGPSAPKPSRRGSSHGRISLREESRYALLGCPTIARLWLECASRSSWPRPRPGPIGRCPPGCERSFGTRLKRTCDTNLGR